jgi:heme exporter protein B
MRAFAALLRRDIVLSLRSGGGAWLGAGFFVLIMVLAPLGLGPNEMLGKALAPLGLGLEETLLRSMAPALIWVAALLATLLGLERIIEPDLQDGTLDLLRMSPLPLELVVCAKVFAHWLTSGLMICILAPLVAPMLFVESNALWAVALSLLLGTPGLSFVGTAGAAISAGVRRGGMLLALIVLPLNIPALIFGAGVINAVQRGKDPTQALLLLAAFTLIAAVVATLAAAAALRLNED